MITSAFLNAIFGIVEFLINKLPAITTTSSIGNSIATASTYISGVYAFIPLLSTTILAIIAFDIIFESGYLMYKVVYWIIRRFPTQS
jgi:hypothetical protein